MIPLAPALQVQAMAAEVRRDRLPLDPLARLKLRLRQVEGWIREERKAETRIKLLAEERVILAEIRAMEPPRGDEDLDPTTPEGRERLLTELDALPIELLEASIERRRNPQ